MEQSESRIITISGTTDRHQQQEQRIKEQAQVIAELESEVLRQQARGDEALAALSKMQAELAELRVQLKR
jgi:hypothetical protein